jgi:hypothetical protein
MGTSVSISNGSKPAPKWFRKLKKAIGILVIAANAMIAQWGLPTTETLKLQLWFTIGIGAVLEAMEVMLANGEEYTSTQNFNLPEKP